jgi:hypothetical protein
VAALPHPLDLIALVLGVLFAIRQMDIAQRQAKNYPHVALPDFERWLARARGAYRLGANVCFAKIMLDIAVAYWMRHTFLPAAVRWGVGLSLDVTWAVLVVLAVWRSQRAHALAREVGVEAPRRKPTAAD